MAGALVKSDRHPYRPHSPQADHLDPDMPEIRRVVKNLPSMGTLLRFGTAAFEHFRHGTRATIDARGAHGASGRLRSGGSFHLPESHCENQSRVCSEEAPVLRSYLTSIALGVCRVPSHTGTPTRPRSARYGLRHGQETVQPAQVFEALVGKVNGTPTLLYPHGEREDFTKL
jgi:hypothetical protein